MGEEINLSNVIPIDQILVVEVGGVADGKVNLNIRLRGDKYWLFYWYMCGVGEEIIIRDRCDMTKHCDCYAAIPQWQLDMLAEARKGKADEKS